jgi:hypothetical protein
MKIVTFITLLLLGSSAWAVGTQKIAGYIGETTGGVAYAFNNLGQKRKLAAKTAVFEGETLITSKAANSSVIFTDGTTIELNPSTQFRVEEFRFGEEEEKPSAVFRMLKGGFRFISGLVNKKGGKLAFKTPTATIGIRGSAGSFDADGTIEVYEGTFTVKTSNGASTNLSQGETASTAKGVLKKTQKMTKADIQARLVDMKDIQKSLSQVINNFKSLGLDNSKNEKTLDDFEAEIKAGEDLLNIPDSCSDCGGTAVCPASPAIFITDPNC